jgi:hypothetical protein
MSNIDMAKSEVELWSICIITTGLVLFSNDSCAIGSILMYQVHVVE